MTRSLARVLAVLVLLPFAGFAVPTGKSHPGTLQTASAPAVPVPDFSKARALAVVDVVDGDTVALDVDGVRTTVRLVGVDTPETVDPRKPVQYYGKEASSFLANLLVGEQVYFVRDEIGDTVDKYQRSLGYLYRVPDGLFVNLEIVRQGYGHAYVKYPFQHSEVFKQYEARARECGKGLWDPEKVPSETDSEPPAPSQSDATVYVTTSGTKYHVASCRYLSKSKVSMSLDEARKRYSPCSVCSPPK